MAVAALTCADCGAQFQSGSRGRKATRCPPCAHQHRNALGRAWRERNAPPKASANMVPHPCTICGRSFVGRLSTLYCSVTCRGRARGAKSLADRLAAAATRQEHECKQCGTFFLPKVKGRTTFCSRDCAFAHKQAHAATHEELKRRAKARQAQSRKAITPAHCKACGTQFSPKSRANAYCSPECLSASHKVPESQPAICAKCGVPCTVGRWSRRLCSSCLDDRKRINRAKSREQQRLNGTKAARRKARKLKQRGVSVETVNPLKVLQRDGWRCQLCGVSTPKSLRGTYDDRAPEVDHILPISQGGEHSYRNTQCACRKCNLAKGSAPQGQMRLFG